ncbi:YIP1 family protein [Paenibacillus sp. 1001270B_150601_E10]|uniref:YIP1 family protein n=1 Tax=Paenibacillus sp. 1001270B_150601_E10 TaxID=2787079 RepID=UPI0018A0EADB|nr:YIP1 family protein [Paenibacillus sp. 1001270B_150601_E10]
MKKRWGRQRLIFIMMVLSMIMAALFPSLASAEPPYTTFSKDGYNRTIPSQAAYYPFTVVGDNIYKKQMENGAERLEYSPLKRPQDLFIDSKDDIYIADTDNNRIVHLNKDGDFVREITAEGMKSPQGVFVTPKGVIYVADTGNKRILKLSSSGDQLAAYGRPESRFIDESFHYEPTNLVVDERGFMYVISNGSYQGVVQFDPSGNFYGFYGTNLTEVSLMDIVRKLLYTEEQLSRQVRTLPATIRNIHIDEQGFIYTVSATDKEQVKKLNIRGENQWKEKIFGIEPRFRNRGSSANTESADPKQEEQKSGLTDITVDRNGNLVAIDKVSNAVTQYGPNGELLFFWVGPVTIGSPQLGISQSPVAVDTNSKNELYVLDDSQNLIHVLKPTEFGMLLHEATTLSQEGKYVESEPIWQEVLRLNALYSPAYQGLAEAAFYKEDYKEALRLFKLAGDASGYSDSFWQLRLQWFQHHFTLVANLFFIALLVLLILNSRKKKLKWLHLKRAKVRNVLGRQKLLVQLKQAFTILRHPIDGFSDLRYHQKGGYLSACILLVLVALVLLMKEYFTSFTFMPVPSNERSSGFLIAIFVTWLTWVVCNYLIGSIRQGEARFKDVFVGSSYALFPIVILGLPLAAVSNVMTASEMSIYSFFETGMLLWCGLLFFWKIQSLQNYSVGETVANVFLTAFAMMIAWVLISIIVGLSSELQNFFYTIYQEVSM